MTEESSAVLRDSQGVSSVYIAWTAFQRRQESMRHVVGFDCWFMPIPKSGKMRKATYYAQKLFESVVRLLRARPDIVWVQLPQVPVLWAALIYRCFAGKQVRIVADCHNAQLRKPWSSFPLAHWSLARSDAILVHNETMHARAAELGWPMNKVFVLEDVPAVGKAQAPAGLAVQEIRAPKPWVLFPGSFAADEPIGEVFEAARMVPECTFIITGRTERARQNGHSLDDVPANVVLPGFLSLDVFDDLLREADVVMGLTKEEGIQLSVCNETLGFGRPLVTSNTRILTKLFGDGAVLVDTGVPESIAQGCREAVNHASEYGAKSLALAERRLFEWRVSQFSPLSAFLSR